ncbi:MAG TPA: peptidoglycan DD-metalloendopeptidase family protein [Gammaproteobacteria bacterium]|nr:peptidoglycan DD-metalloendopeptidase family protein [Gammaproteobacteria bacterium]
MLAKSNHISNSNATLSLKKAGTRSATLDITPLDSVAEPAPVQVAKITTPLQETGLAVWQTITVQVGDTLSNLFDRLGISKLTYKNLMASGKSVDELTKIYPGQKLDFLFDDSKDLKAVKFNLSTTKTLHVTNEGSKFKYSYEEQKPIKKLNFSTGKIAGSLYSSAQTAGLNEKLIMQMADILACDIDFTLDVRDNDSFRVLYEEEFVNEKKINQGKILAIEFNNQGKSYKAVHYTDDKGHTGYYSPDGYSLQKAFLRSPVEFTRISSHFSKARLHPILHKIRAHKGVDYAAPTGTPIKSAGDGRVSFLGTKNGYGKSIEITHGQKYSTFYAHLSRFHKQLRHGSYVKQGQIIGYVGKTGLATAPHLHYEFRINGVHHNPVTVPLPSASPIPIKSKTAFNTHAKNVLALLDTHSQEAKDD